jgi:26S proteasome regulatory subunit N4
MEQIKRALEVMHSFSGQVATSVVAKEIELIPFALVNGVAPDSPASTAGLLRGDKILQFGDITSSVKDSLSSIGKLVMESEFKSVRVRVLRNDEKVALIVTPMQWTGKGLLGCHLTPL